MGSIAQFVATRKKSMVKIYSTKNCGYCKLAKEYFVSRGIQYEEVRVDEDREALLGMIEKTGRMSVPVIEIDGEIIVGFDKKKIEDKLA